MTITLDLKPEVEARLRGEAEARGLGVEEYVLTVIEHADESPKPKQLSEEEFQRTWALLAVGSEGLPSLTDEDLSREALYADHD